MSRLGRRHWMTTAAAIVAVFALPAAAQAATYTVDAGNGPCGAPADLACGSLAEAAIAAVGGDTFNISPGTYDAAEFDDSALTINGAPGVAINGTMTFSGNGGGPTKLSKVAISQPVGNAPAINVNGTSGLQIFDSAVVSLNGNAIIMTAGAINAIIRTLVVTAGQETAAVLVESAAGTPTKGLLLESSLLTGGGAGLRAVTTNTAIQAGAGDINIIARHLTAAGSTLGIHLDASNAASLLAGPVGNIRATLSDSIALNNKTQRFALIGGANEASITADSRSMQTGDPALLFADPGRKNFRLRPDSPAIDKGGFTTGESATDIDGDARPGPTTDLGADEFVNARPVASIVVKTAKPRAGQPVLLDGTGSSDREGLAGGGIVQYRWDFGDGTTENTTTPSVLHTYGGEGAAAAQLVVVDKQGLASTPAIARVDVGDGTPPEITITKPFANQRIRLTTKRTRNVTTNGVTKKVTTTSKTRLNFTGAAKDKNGVGFVLLTIEKLSSATATSARASQTTSTRAQCTWFDAKKGLLRVSCVKPKLIVAKLLNDGTWSYTVSSKVKRPSAGLYRVSVYGADGTGAFGNSAPAKDSVIRFRLAK